mmetsp:Transcript_12797/g.16264  ORF Transcript_12797/g.16264 Transcript_12797/m.16264 type:complete len:92 (-) Transcript_12797:783-1058(-)
MYDQSKHCFALEKAYIGSNFFISLSIFFCSEHNIDLTYRDYSEVVLSSIHQEVHSFLSFFKTPAGPPAHLTWKSVMTANMMFHWILKPQPR